MAPPAALVRTARQLWHAQWLALMGGLGPADAAGRYRRPASAFAALPPLPADAAAPEGHVLIVGRSCPWAHRAWLAHSLRQLQATVSVVVVDPDPAAGRWRFASPFEGCGTLAELYRASGADPTLPASVPALYSRQHRRIVVNESARLIELLDDWPGPGPSLWPETERPAIATWRERFQHAVNDGVYRCGFARTQAAYDEAEAELFAALEAVEVHLQGRERAAGDSMIAAAAPPSTDPTVAAEQSSGPWLCGPEPSLADVVLFPTLIRLELVYAPLFGCSRLPLRQLPALHRWRARFHGLPGVAATCFPEAWRRDYFGALFPLHPSGIIPAGPALADLVAT
ncbi:MAG: glutathione S-transferase C-terminal domain-containing protein [Cyanobium sp.]